MAADHTLTPFEVAKMFGWTDLEAENYDHPGVVAGCAHLVDDPFNSNRGTVLKVDFKKDNWGYGKSDINPTPMGMQIDLKYSGVSNFTEVYFAMDVAFPADPYFIFPMSIHSWNMKSNYIATYAELPRIPVADEARLFTANLGQLNSVTDERVPNTGGDHSLGNYVYYADRIQQTKHWTDNPTLAPNDADANAIYAQHIRGTWMRMETHCKLNTFIGDTDQNNGILETWVNQQKVLDIQDFHWRNKDFKDYNFQNSTFSTWIGGDKQEFAVVQDQSMYFDRLIVSNNRITG